MVTAVAYSICHHLGSVPDGFGGAGRGTRIADWVDLLVPFVVLLPALGTLLAARVGRARYLWFDVGSWLDATDVPSTDTITSPPLSPIFSAGVSGMTRPTSAP